MFVHVPHAERGKELEKAVEEWREWSGVGKAPGEVGVQIRTGGLDDVQLLALVKRAKCLVHPSRGEAWGLTVIEALSCGVPVIAPVNGGQSMFLRKRHCRALKCGQPVELGRLTNVVVDLYQGCQFFNPDVDDLVRAILDVVEHWKFYKRRAMRGRRFVERYFQWDRAVDVMERRLLEIGRKVG